MKNLKRNRLGTKDFINIGIYSALYFVLQLACGMIFSFTPISYMFMCAATAFITGPIFMLLALKVQKKGTIFLLSLILGALFLLLGSWYGALYTWGLGFISEIIALSGKYINKMKLLFAYVVLNMSCWMMTYSPLLLFKEYWYKINVEAGTDMEGELMIGLSKMFDGPLGIVSFVVTLICSGLGALFGIRLLKKHFEKAGVLNVTEI